MMKLKLLACAALAVAALIWPVDRPESVGLLLIGLLGLALSGPELTDEA